MSSLVITDTEAAVRLNWVVPTRFAVTEIALSVSSRRSGDEDAPPSA